MTVKFYGKPLDYIESKQSGKVLFRFDTKGEFITDDDKIIERAIGFFDYAEIKIESIGERVEKTFIVPPLTITTQDTAEKESIEETPIIEQEKKVKHCKKCDFTCENQGELLAHYRAEHSNKEE